MKGSFQPPTHRPPSKMRSPVPVLEELGEGPSADPFVNRPCYEFNARLRTTANDRRCVHCRHYLTPRCPEIDEFLDDVDDLGPE